MRCARREREAFIGTDDAAPRRRREYASRPHPRFQLTMNIKRIEKNFASVALACLLAACGSTSVVKQPVAAMPANLELLGGHPDERDA